MTTGKQPLSSLGLAQDRGKPLSRRAFMERALAAGMTVSAASLLWSDKVLADTPKRGGLFRVGMDDSNTTDQLDPATAESHHMIQMNHAIRNYLTEITEDNVVGPELAAGWEATPDATRWTFDLVKEATFHNGKPFTARDAMDSLNHHRGDTNSAAKPLLEAVTEIKTDGDHTLVVTLNAGSADFPYILTDYHLAMMPSNGEGGVDADSGIGTGGYQIKAHEPGVESVLERNPNYWKPDHAWFDGVQFLALNDPNARQTAIRTKQVDAITEPELKTLHLLAQDEDLVVDEVASGAHVTLPMFVDQAPFDNNDLRLALKYGINRDEILQKVLRGHGTLGNDHPIGPTLPYWANLEQRQYDPDRAKHHLKKAGMEGAKVTLSTAETAFPGAVDMAVLFKEHLAPVGIDLTIDRQPNDGYWSNVWLVKPFVVVGWGARPTPDVMFSLAYAKGAAWNESHFADERFNKLLVEARAELDDDKRHEIYAEMQEILRDRGGTIVPFFRNRVIVRRSTVRHGEKLTGNWALDGARASERWWFAEGQG
ncbi:MAG: ABC transporter substrate-binding protein [Pseudomonadota bacterium]